jgi:hypothetical protein
MSTDERFEILDKFIASNKPSKKTPFSFYISCRDLDYGQKILEQMKQNTEPSYKIFGNCGYSSFALYKSSENIIYFIKVYLQTIEEYIVMNLETGFKY